MGLTMENVASQETVLSSRLTAGCPRNGVFSGHCYGIWQIDFQDAVEQLIMCRAGDHYKEMMCVCVCVLGNFQLFATPWTVALCYSPWYCRLLWTVASWIEAPLFMGFSGQEYWSKLPFSTPEYLPDPGTEPMSLASPALGGRFFTTEPPGESHKKLSDSKFQWC